MKIIVEMDEKESCFIGVVNEIEYWHNPMYGLIVAGRQISAIDAIADITEYTINLIKNERNQAAVMWALSFILRIVSFEKNFTR